MKKLRSYFFIGLGVAAMGLVFVGMFFLDIGINSKFFIKKHFYQAFHYRITGDCTSFADYLYRDVEKWKDICEKEKANDAEPIRNFTVKNVSHKLGSNRAFLQVELTRKVNGKDYTYSVNYEMKRIWPRWKIDQEKK